MSYNHKPKLHGKQLLYCLIKILVIFFIFFYGVGVGHYKWFPFNIIQSTRQLVLNESFKGEFESIKGEFEIFKYAFTDKVINRELYYAPITSLSDIRKANERIFIRSDNFKTAYREIKDLAVDQIKYSEKSLPVVRVKFKYQNKQHEAFAYGLLPIKCHSTKASLIIPGSGLNQSSGIALNDPKNYHQGILDALNPKKIDSNIIFVLIKPNEDFLAWHDGNERKINGNFIWNWHLNRKGSYSVSYLVQSLAITKWMQSCFKRVTLAGLSQGAEAVLLNAIQSKPYSAIAASGISLIKLDVEHSGHDQLIGVPGITELYEPKNFYDVLKSTPTQFFFSWGSKEIGLYKIEAERQITANTIKELPNAKVIIHNKGHVFPIKDIKNWILELDNNK